MRLVILHYHFLKNAGTSIEDMLHRSFGGYFKAVDTADRDGHVTNEALLDLLKSQPLLRAVSSHQFRYPMPLAPGFLFFDVCFLRDPIDRLRSMYDYFREKPVEGDPVSELASRTRLGEFVLELVERMPWHINDAQVNLLANGVANDPPTAQDFERAVAGMLRCSFPGVVDRYAQSLAAGEFFLRPVFPELNCSGEASNVLGGLASTLEKRIESVRQACASEVFEKLMKLNAQDFKLLNLARAEVERRFRLAQKARRLLAREAAGS
jgi:hypothetical protein